MTITRIAYLVNNPIQYQAPMLRSLAKCDNIKLHVIFRSRISLKPHKIPGFQVIASWDLDLLDGYQHSFLPCLGSDEKFSFFRPWNYGLFKFLKANKFDILWIHGYSDFFNLYAIIIAKFLKMKILVRGESYLLESHGGKLRNLLRKHFFAWLGKTVDGCLAIGTANRKFYQFYNIPAEKIFFAPYTVDNNFFQAKISKNQENIENLRQKLGLNPKKLVLLYVSSMLERKHPEDLLAAYMRLSPDGITPPNAYLIFVGDGIQRTKLQQQAHATGWNTIKILGFKNQTELPLYYGLSDIFVLPSVYETWGLVVNEVMNAGKAVIVSDQVGASQDLVQDGINGYIYPARDINALHQALEHLISNPSLCKQMGTHSLNTIKQWGIETTVSGIIAACEKVLNISATTKINNANPN